MDHQLRVTWISFFSGDGPEVNVRVRDLTMPDMVKVQEEKTHLRLQESS